MHAKPSRKFRVSKTPFPMHEIALTTPPAPVHTFVMGRPKQFDERIQLTLVEGTTGRIDALLMDGEYRLDFIRTAIEVEIAKRSQEKPVTKHGRPSLAGMFSGPTPKKR
jgi:hypothetical protein